MTNLRLLAQARQKLQDHPKNVAVRRGKERLSLGDILLISDDLIKLWESKSLASPEKSNAILVQQDELRQERDSSIELMKAAQKERDQLREERNICVKQNNALQKERDALFREKEHYREESETLKQERDELQTEKEHSRQRRLVEESDRESNRNKVVPQTDLEEAKVRSDQLLANNTRYRRERDDARREYASLSKEMDQYQARAEKVEEELKEAETQLSTSNLAGKGNYKLYLKALDGERAASKQVEQLDSELGTLRSTSDQDRQAFELQLDGLKAAHVAVVPERDRLSVQFKDSGATHRRELELGLRQQRTSLQGTANVQLNGLRGLLTREHKLAMQNVKRGWEQKKAQLQTSADADRVAVSNVMTDAKERQKLDSATLKTHLDALRLSREATARNQETMYDLVIAVAVSQSSYNDLHSGFIKGRRIIKHCMSRIQVLQNELTVLQGRVVTLTSESSCIQQRLRCKEKELNGLSTANEANILRLRDTQSDHAICKRDQRLQLGRLDRHTILMVF